MSLESSLKSQRSAGSGHSRASQQHLEAFRVRLIRDGTPPHLSTLAPSSKSKPSPSPTPLRTHWCRPTPGSSGPGHFPQHDEASSGDAAHGVDGFLGYFLTVQIEFDLEVAHGHVYLGGGWKEKG